MRTVSQGRFHTGTGCPLRRRTGRTDAPHEEIPARSPFSIHRIWTEPDTTTTTVLFPASTGTDASAISPRACAAIGRMRG